MFLMLNVEFGILNFKLQIRNAYFSYLTILSMSRERPIAKEMPVVEGVLL